MSESIIERIVRILSETNCQDSDLCKYIGISQSTFTNWKNRNTDPKAKYIPDIAEFLGVDAHYLMTGNNMAGNLVPYYLDPEAAEIAQEVQARPELKILFDASRKVSADDLNFVVNMLDRLKKDEGK